MAKLPRAPDRARLASLEPALRTLAPGTPLYRIYFRGGAYPATWRRFRHFGPVSRFDHQTRDAAGERRVQERGVLYAAGDIATAIAETFQRNRRRIDPVRDEPWLASFEVVGPAALLDLSDTFCVRAGASMKLASGPFSFAQRWACGFYESYADIAGIRYPSSLTNRPTVVLFERADSTAVLPEVPLLNRSLDDPLLRDVLRTVAAEIGYRLL